MINPTYKKAFFTSAPSAEAYLGDLKSDGSVPLTADWNVGAFNLTVQDIITTRYTIPSNYPNTKVWSNFEDFVGYANSNFGIWAVINSGTGATCVTSPSNMDNTRIGMAITTTGTTNSGYAGIRTNIQAFEFGAGVYTFETQIKLSALSNSTETYTVYVGFGDTNTGDQNDGVYFKYSDVGGETPTPNWYKCSAVGGSRTATSTGVAATTDWVKLKIVINADATSAEYFIDGVSVGVVTTNLPGTAAQTGALIEIIKSAGTTARTFFSDWVWIHANLSAYR